MRSARQRRVLDGWVSLAKALLSHSLECGRLHRRVLHQSASRGATFAAVGCAVATGVGTIKEEGHSEFSDKAHVGARGRWSSARLRVGGPRDSGATG